MAFYERGQLNNICNSTQQSAIAQSVVSEMEKAVNISSMASTLMQFFLKLNNMCNSTQLNSTLGLFVEVYICKYQVGVLCSVRLKFATGKSLEWENSIELPEQCFCDMVLLHQCCELVLDALGGVQSTYKSCCMLFQHSCVP